MRTPEGDKVWKIIRAHVGRPQAIGAIEIAQRLKWRPSQERMVRQIISDEAHLWPGILVCATPGKGYFCAETYEEAENYDNWLSGLVTAAQNKRTAFRTACEKMGFRFTKLNARAPARKLEEVIAR
jgi:hypothetical protein